MKKAIPLATIFLFAFIGCLKRKLIGIPVYISTDSLTEQMRHKLFVGNNKSVYEYQQSAGSHLQLDSSINVDTFQFFPITNTPYFQFDKDSKFSYHFHDLYFSHRNDTKEYIMLRGRMTDTSLLLHTPIVLSNQFQNSNTGPESCLVYYYAADSAVYFWNFSPNLSGTFGGGIYPYYNSYYLCTLKGI